MLLNGHGFVPGDPATHHVFGKHEVEARWGPAVEFVEGIGAPCRGFELRDEDGEEYNLYVTELFERVHQRPLLRRVLPLHFARGLGVEAKGEPVNWVAFAMRRCFPGQKKTPFAPGVRFANVVAPYPWIHGKVPPIPDGPAPRLVRPANPVSGQGLVE